jgi:hypothetical protein
MGSLLVVVSTPSLAFSPRVVEAHEPMRIQALGAELAIERLDEGVVGRFARPGEVKRGDGPLGEIVELPQLAAQWRLLTVAVPEE